MNPPINQLELVQASNYLTELFKHALNQIQLNRKSIFVQKNIVKVKLNGFDLRRPRWLCKTSIVRVNIRLKTL